MITITEKKAALTIVRQAITKVERLANMGWHSIETDTAAEQLRGLQRRIQRTPCRNLIRR